MNQKIRNLENTIIGLINNSELPVEVCRLVVSEIYNKLDRSASEVILSEMKPEPIEEKGDLEDAEGT